MRFEFWSWSQDPLKSGLFRARSVLPTLAERPPLSDMQAWQVERV